MIRGRRSSGWNVFVACLSLGLAGCAGKGHVDATPKPAGTVELVGLFPEAGSTVDPETVIVAVLRYEVRPFKRGVYYLMPQLATHDPRATSSGPIPLGDYPRLKSATGRASVNLPVSGVWKDRNILKPLQVWFYLNREDGGGRSSIVAKAGPFLFPAGEGEQ